MLLIIGCILLAVWLFGFIVMKKMVGGLIHIILIIALIVLVMHFFAARGSHL